jgi:hypothetical protein
VLELRRKQLARTGQLLGLLFQPVRKDIDADTPPNSALALRLAGLLIYVYFLSIAINKVAGWVADS